MKNASQCFAALSRSRGALHLLTLTLGVTVARSAWASPTFPMEIQAHLQLSSPPACTICHNNPNGGIGTATTPFAVAMKNAGLQSENLASLDAALDALAISNPADIQALKDGLDPNTGQAESAAPRYGCGARVAPGKVESSSVVTLALTLLGLVLVSRRQRT